MSCHEARTLLHAFVDDELDLVRSLDVQNHLDTCPACAREHEAHRALRAALRDDTLYFRAPEGFSMRVRSALRAQGATEHAADRRGFAAWADTVGAFLRMPWAWLPAGAMAAVLVMTAVTIWRFGLTTPGPSTDELLGQEVIASHVRSLMASHLTDVPSSDQHTVKPWFSGRLDFSPPVRDLADQGFALVGGRLDYLAGRPVAALVYERRRHIINLMVWPASRVPDRPVAAATRQGYHVIHWIQGEVSYWAVSDLNEGEMREFVGLIKR
jgi:anti-sigma factor RsiW